MIAPRQRRVALLVAGCFFMEMLDGTIVTTSAPQIARSLAVPANRVSLIVTSYIVTLAALVPVSGWMSARWGARRVFLCAIGLFTLASLGCAVSQSLPELVAMRVLQGAGGAMMVPVGRLVVLSRTEKADLMTVTAYLIWPALIAPVIAPLAGGVITTYASWHWLFLINVPLGVVAFLAALRLIDSPEQRRPPPLDIPGVVLSCGGLAGLTVTAGVLTEARPQWSLVLAVGLASTLMLALAIAHLLRCPAPLLDLGTLRIHTLRFALGGSSIFFLVVGAVPFLVPLLFQEVFGWSSIKSGAVVLFIFVGNIAIKPATTFLYGRLGFRAMLIASTALMAATMVIMAFTTAATPVAVIGLVLALSGVARSAGGTGYTTLAFSDVPEAQMNDASTLQATAQQLSLGFGVAAGAIALRAGHPLGHLFSPHYTLRTPYAVAFVLLGLLSLIATFGATRLHPGAGDVLRRAGARTSSPVPTPSR